MTSLTAMPRAGQLECICEPGALGDTASDHRGTALLAAGFAFSVLAQVLTLSILPLAGLSFAPGGSLATLPYAAFYVGAAVASLPASFLLDSFGRRAAFSLGASLGAAGGLVLVWALVSLHFGALVLGAFWLGIAGGFSLFYRHAAVPVGGRGASTLLIIFGAATLAGLIAPTIAGLAETLASPRIFAGTAAAAALAHVGSLMMTASLSYQRHRERGAETTGSQDWRSILLPTAIGALGWFAMTALMGATPLAVIGCAPSDAVVGAVAWHVMAMYAPSLALAVLPRLALPVPLSVVGCLLLMAGALAFMLAGTAGGFSVAAALAGAGWSLVMLGTTLWVHGGAPVSRVLLGLHDGTLLTGAILGALAANVFA
ncbi:MFS transporter [Microvirga sp. VF16]|uniref:MFS transporter n=1 Tax=Microvirga sp. VF16 TaxID=2807101 RepID=UPI00193CD320|nr:MFS transporter [Microvirga sp. VF16]QRM27314.1 MFS transporter [Microvirga sp. VF16]